MEFDTDLITSKFEDYTVTESRNFVTILVKTPAADREFAYQLADTIAAANGCATERQLTSKSTLPILLINHK